MFFELNTNSQSVVNFEEIENSLLEQTPIKINPTILPQLVTTKTKVKKSMITNTRVKLLIKEMKHWVTINIKRLKSTNKK